MKKLSIIISLILIVTIGGVYATWNYVSESDQAFTTSPQSVKLDGITDGGLVGNYTISANFEDFLIDQNKGTDSTPSAYHKAVLKPIYTATGATSPEIVITFEPTATASADILANGVPTYIWFDLTAVMQFKVDENGFYSETGTLTDVFNITHDEDNYITIHPADTTDEELEDFATADGKEHYKWTKSGDVFSVTIVGAGTTHTTLDGIVEINNFVIDNANVHTLFKNVLTGSIRCTVSNKTPAEFVRPGESA